MKDRLEAMSVADIMTQWPQTVLVFVRRGMACPGCGMARFTTVREAAREYAAEADELTRDLTTSIEFGVNPAREAPDPAPLVISRRI